MLDKSIEKYYNITDFSPMPLCKLCGYICTLGGVLLDAANNTSKLG